MLVLVGLNYTAYVHLHKAACNPREYKSTLMERRNVFFTQLGNCNSRAHFSFSVFHFSVLRQLGHMASLNSSEPLPSTLSTCNL